MESSNYDDIINVKYPFELKHKRMDIMSRAAQFSAFDPLSGYEEGISDAAQQAQLKAETVEKVE